MAGITIAGIPLDLSEGGELEPTWIGEESRAFAGNQRNAIRGNKRNFGGVTIPYVEATWDTVRAAVANRAQVTVSGMILSGDSITASVTVNAKPVPGLPDYWIITFAGAQV